MSLVWKALPTDRIKIHMVDISLQSNVSWESDNESGKINIPHYWKVNIVDSTAVKKQIDECMAACQSDSKNCSSGRFTFTINSLPGDRSEQITLTIGAVNGDEKKILTEKIQEFLTAHLVLPLPKASVTPAAKPSVPAAEPNPPSGGAKPSAGK